MSKAQEHLLDYIRSPKAIREQSKKLYAMTQSGEGHFLLDEDKLDDVADYVIGTIRSRYPALDIPYHSRWRHFSVEGSTALAQFEDATQALSTMERARASTDLIFPSVLLDAGAGQSWRFSEPGSEVSIGRSEGLGLASLHLFQLGAFSKRADDPLRTDGCKLAAITVSDIAEGFQVSSSNPLIGVAGRAELLRRLGKVLQSKPHYFPDERPGDLVEYLVDSTDGDLTATHILKTVLDSIGDIWPSRIQLGDKNPGDVWRHPKLGHENDGLIPFHKLSQWLSYSIIETLETSGITVSGISELTGLAEYRNGGLFIDTDLLKLEQPGETAFCPDHETIVEWRALTIELLDKLAAMIRAKLGKTEGELPLVRILEGGTWFAGRKIANELRPGGNPPITLSSDGTVF